MNKKMVIIGAGWLGDALAQQAIQEGWEVQATHRHHSQQDYDRIFNLNEVGELTHTVSLTGAYWVCAMSPGERRGPSNYLQTLEQALILAKHLDAQGSVLCSSTGVYDNESGHFDETSELSLSSERQQRLHKAEQLALEAGAKVVRLGGLVGPDREPGRFVSGKELSSHAEDTVNMVHRGDVINALLVIFERFGNSDNIYNLVHPSHPNKGAYYRAHCQKLGTTEPSFSAVEATRRYIDGTAIEKLGFTYKHDI
ncbi:NADP-binding protein [Pseudoalteromonas sp. YIC-656]|uniref:NADP-binding protein n=1 Tax=Pseudoalteromonas pernae TaxID=3118054 RepID=UPI00324203CF